MVNVDVTEPSRCHDPSKPFRAASSRAGGGAFGGRGFIPSAVAVGRFPITFSAHASTEGSAAAVGAVGAVGGTSASELAFATSTSFNAGSPAIAAPPPPQPADCPGWHLQ